MNLDSFFMCLIDMNMFFETCPLFMLSTMISIIINIHFHKASIFVHAHVD